MTSCLKDPKEICYSTVPMPRKENSQDQTVNPINHKSWGKNPHRRKQTIKNSSPSAAHEIKKYFLSSSQPL